MPEFELWGSEPDIKTIISQIQEQAAIPMVAGLPIVTQSSATFSAPWKFLCDIEMHMGSEVMYNSAYSVVKVTVIPTVAEAAGDDTCWDANDKARPYFTWAGSAATDGMPSTGATASRYSFITDQDTTKVRVYRYGDPYEAVSDTTATRRVYVFTVQCGTTYKNVIVTEPPYVA